MEAPEEDKSAPRFSIVVNNYNYERYVAEAIESALAQSHDSFEVIVVDDGSTDTSPIVLEGYADRTTLIQKENGGQGSAFNAGFARARGEWILFLDADDALYPDALARLDAFLDAQNEIDSHAVVFYRLDVMDGESQPVPGQTRPSHAFPEETDFRDQVLRSVHYPTAPTSGNLYRAAALREFLPMPERPWRICADAFLHLRCALEWKILYLDQPLGRYRIHGNNRWHVERGHPVSRSRLDAHIAIESKALARRYAESIGSRVETEVPHINEYLLDLRVRAPELLRDLLDTLPSERELALDHTRLQLLFLPDLGISASIKSLMWAWLVVLSPEPIDRRLAPLHGFRRKHVQSLRELIKAIVTAPHEE